MGMADAILPPEDPPLVEVVPLPAHLGALNADQVGDQLAAAIRNEAAVVVADMSGLASWERAGAAAVVRAYQRATVNGTDFRLVAGTEAAWDLVTAEQLNRLVPVFPSLQAALGAPPRGGELTRLVAPVPAALPHAAVIGHGAGAVSEVVLRQLIDTLADGIVLTDQDGTIVLASRQFAEMFGYTQDQLTGLDVETLVPVGLRDAHRRDRSAYLRKPEPRPMSERPGLVGLRQDGTMIPVSITLSPVPTAGQHLILGVVSDSTRPQRRHDLSALARATVSGHGEQHHELLDKVVRSLFQVGLSLQAALDQPADTARERISDALQRLDETIRQVRDHIFGDPHAR
jgi:PAS domain S-box-containing protein